MYRLYVVFGIIKYRWLLIPSDLVATLVITIACEGILPLNCLSLEYDFEKT